ncbi:hypothetical protein EMIT0111MI5_520003 [Burkholderia sp. IT-111MI5]
MFRANTRHRQYEIAGGVRGRFTDAARSVFARTYDLHSNLSEKLIVWNLIWFPLVRAC